MKVLFVYPNLYAQIGFNYGVAFLSAVLKAAGHQTSLVNINEKLYPSAGPEDLLARVRRENPDLVGFSVVTNQFQYSVEMAREIRRFFPDTPIVIGGVHATMDPRAALETGAFDYACVGEGEGALLDLVEALENRGDTTAIPNIWAARDGRIIANAVRPFMPLEELPPKDYDIFDFQHMIDAKNGWVGLMTSRGCPFRCSYCFNHRMVALYQRDTGLSMRELNYVRHHRLEDVIDEIRRLTASYKNIRMFIFDDDLFTFDRQYVREFCARYREVSDIPFVCNAHVRFMDEELATALKNGGCKVVKFGLESGSERVRREVMHRNMSDDEIKRAFAAVHAAGIHSSAFVMMGLPSETPAEMDETIELLARIRPGRFRWAIFFPYINTDAYDLAVKLGLVDFDKMRSMPNFTDESCLDFGPPQNLKIRKFHTAYPWYVNARCGDGVVSRLFSRLTEVIDRLDEDAFENFRPQVETFDVLLNRVVKKAGHELYSLRYNSFTAVTSEWND